MEATAVPVKTPKPKAVRAPRTKKAFKDEPLVII